MSQRGSWRRHPRRSRWQAPERSGRIGEGILPLLEQATRERTPVSLLYRSLWSRRQTWRGLDPYGRVPSGERLVPWSDTATCATNLVRSVSNRIVEAKRLDGRLRSTAVRPSMRFLQQTWSVYRGRTPSRSGHPLRSIIGAAHPARGAPSRRAHQEAQERTAAVPRHDLAPGRDRPLDCGIRRNRSRGRTAGPRRAGHRDCPRRVRTAPAGRTAGNDRYGSAKQPARPAVARRGTFPATRSDLTPSAGGPSRRQNTRAPRGLQATEAASASIRAAAGPFASVGGTFFAHTDKF